MCKHRREWKVKEYKMIKNAQVLSKSIEKGVKKSHTSPAAGKVKIEKGEAPVAVLVYAGMK